MIPRQARIGSLPLQMFVGVGLGKSLHFVRHAGVGHPGPKGRAHQAHMALRQGPLALLGPDVVLSPPTPCFCLQDAGKLLKQDPTQREQGGEGWRGQQGSDWTREGSAMVFSVHPPPPGGYSSSRVQ